MKIQTHVNKNAACKYVLLIENKQEYLNWKHWQVQLLPFESS